MVLQRTAQLDGFDGMLLRRGAEGGEWVADLEPDLLVALLQAAASGDEVSLVDAGGVRKVIVRRCWYDVNEEAVRASFETCGLSA